MLVLQTFGMSFHPDRRAGVGCRACGAACRQASCAVGGWLQAGGDSGDLGGAVGRGSWWHVHQHHSAAVALLPTGLCARGGAEPETILAWTHLHGS